MRGTPPKRRARRKKFSTTGARTFTFRAKLRAMSSASASEASSEASAAVLDAAEAGAGAAAPAAAAGAAGGLAAGGAAGDAAGAVRGVVVLALGMAGAGKSSLVQRLNAECLMRGKAPYVVNLDPAVARTPFAANIDIRDTVDYAGVMREYSLGPNGAIITALNLFSTRFDQVLRLLAGRMPATDVCLVDTPGQIEVFTWSASGAIIADSLAASFPTVLLYVVDAPRSAAPVTFMSNMLYACSIMYKTRLPMVIALNKADVAPAAAADCLAWMEDFELFQAALDAEAARSDAYIFSLARSLNLALDEFYSSIRAVAVSAGTGEGMPELFAAIADARQEYMDSYAGELRAAAAPPPAAAAAAGAGAGAAAGAERTGEA